MSPLKATSIALLVLVITAMSRATDFVLQQGYPSGGSVSGATTQNYSMSNGNYGGTMGGSSASASGEITYRFIWGSMTAPAPKNVVLIVRSKAAWQGTAGGTTKAANGLGDPEVKSYAPNSTTVIGGTSSGTKAFITPANAGVVEYKISPEASTSLSGTASVSVSVEIHEIKLSVAGTVFIPGGQGLTCMAGTKQTASISIDSNASLRVTRSGSWQVSGPLLFEKVVNGSPNAMDARAYDLTLTTNEDQCVFYAGKSGLETVSCGVLVEWNHLGIWIPLGSTTESIDIDVREPAYDIVLTPSNTVFGTNNQGKYGVQGGMEFAYWANDPSDFVASSPNNERGKFALCQLIDAKVDATRQSGSVVSIVDTDGYELDNVFPMQGEMTASTTANSPDRTSDFPVYLFATGADPDVSVAIDLKFFVSLIYKGPGGESQYVPLVSQAWKWGGTATKDSGGQWSWSGGPAQVVGSKIPNDLSKAEWTARFTNF